MWLTGRLAPDFKTIADFRRHSGAAIRKVCGQFVVLCRQLNLFTQAVVAIDGSKFKAVNSRDRNFTPTKIDKRVEQIEQSIQRYLESMETADRTQLAEAEAKTKRLGEKIERLRQRVRQLDQLKEKLQAQEDSQLSTTDPDSRSMTSDGRATGVVGLQRAGSRGHQAPPGGCPRGDEQRQRSRTAGQHGAASPRRNGQA
jgi:TolA-binding protein